MLLELLIVRMFGLHVYRKFEFEDIGDKFSPISSLFHVVKESFQNSKVGFMIHTYGPIDPKVYFNHMGCMLNWSRNFNVVFLGIDKHRTADARNILVNAAKSWDCTHLLIVDADHLLPTHTLECLSLNEDARIVSGLVTKRKPPYSQVGFILSEDDKYYYPIDINIDGRSYLVDVPAMGCTLIEMSVFDEINEPYFIDTADFRATGEFYNKRSDINFFEKARKAGIKMIVDSRVLVGHLKEAEAVYPNNVPNTKKLNQMDKIKEKQDSLKCQNKVYKFASELALPSKDFSVLDLGCGHPAK